ncbi:hypothetical protein JL720_2905 [Aureococcus anophagefferens]|nr:hypothetical protein JL720_2905 [Aureococcus anophagefferens]
MGARSPARAFAAAAEASAMAAVIGERDAALRAAADEAARARREWTARLGDAEAAAAASSETAAALDVAAAKYEAEIVALKEAHAAQVSAATAAAAASRERADRRLEANAELEFGVDTLKDQLAETSQLWKDDVRAQAQAFAAQLAAATRAKDDEIGALERTVEARDETIRKLRSDDSLARLERKHATALELAAEAASRRRAGDLAKIEALEARLGAETAGLEDERAEHKAALERLRSALHDEREGRLALARAETAAASAALDTTLLEPRDAAATHRALADLSRRHAAVVAAMEADFETPREASEGQEDAFTSAVAAVEARAAAEKDALAARAADADAAAAAAKRAVALADERPRAHGGGVDAGPARATTPRGAEATWSPSGSAATSASATALKNATADADAAARRASEALETALRDRETAAEAFRNLSKDRDAAAPRGRNGERRARHGRRVPRPARRGGVLERQRDDAAAAREREARATAGELLALKARVDASSRAADAAEAKATGLAARLERARDDVDVWKLAYEESQTGAADVGAGRDASAARFEEAAREADARRDADRAAHGEAARRLEARLEGAAAAALSAARAASTGSRAISSSRQELASTRDVMDAAERDATALLRAERDAAAGWPRTRSLTDAATSRRVETGARRAGTWSGASTRATRRCRRCGRRTPRR